jgi:hypothetical protein
MGGATEHKSDCEIQRLIDDAQRGATTMNLLERLAREAALVTPEQMAAATASLMSVQEGEEQVLTVLDRPDIQRLWALAHEYDKRGSLATFEAKFVAITEQEKDAALPKIAQLESMEDLLRNIVWQEIRDIDPPSLYAAECLGLRAGYVVVKTESPKTKAQRRLESLLRSPIAKLIGLQVVKFDGDDEPEEKDEDEKIQ